MPEPPGSALFTVQVQDGKIGSQFGNVVVNGAAAEYSVVSGIDVVVQHRRQQRERFESRAGLPVRLGRQIEVHVPWVGRGVKRE